MTMLVKTIILSKFHTSKTIHNHSGKTADISTVLKSTQYHNLITQHSGYSKYMVLPPVLTTMKTLACCWNACSASL